MSDISKVTDVIRKLLEDDFGKANIIDVRVKEDIAFDDERFLRIDVIHGRGLRDKDRKKRTSLIRRLRPKLLDEAGETAFPSISFISREDALADSHGSR
jgi:hypothetical protein